MYWALRAKVCVQRSDCALAAGDRLDFGDLAGHLRCHGDDKAVKRVYRPTTIARIGWPTFFTRVSSSKAACNGVPLGPESLTDWGEEGVWGSTTAGAGAGLRARPGES